MGFFNRKNENVRIKKNTNDDQGLYYDPIHATDIYGEIDDLLGVNELNKFRLLKTERSERYNSFDLMGQDSRVASILNMYADDCTQYSQSGKVIWAESADSDCADFANRIISCLQLNKNAWSHLYSLCKYGDLYLETFYDGENDYNVEGKYLRPTGSTITEHIEMIKNPATIFDLIEKGKTAHYIKVNTDNENYDTVSNKLMHTQYNKNENNLILPSDKFIHICINDAYNRFPNKYILLDTKSEKEYSYDIKEGTSILANAFKVWSELNLLEDSVLLNRLSKSAIIRIIQMEVGNADENDTIEALKKLRDKISRSRYLDKSTGEYKNQVNPGPLENIIYHATHKGNGEIKESTIGGDVDVKALADLDHFLEKFANAFPVPLAYVKQVNDDGGGLSAGTSITKLDARYGRTLKRYQNAYANGITDLINLFAYKRGVQQYVNNFTIKMVSPSAVEDNERDEKLTNHTNMIREIMNVIQSLEYKGSTQKRILTYLIQTLIQDNELTDILQDDLQETIDSEKNNESENNTDSLDDFKDSVDTINEPIEEE